MLRLIIAIAGLACATSLAHAAEAGKVIFVAGKAQIVDRAAVEGSPVQEGELLSTGKDGFIYVKTIDNGLFILRPNTQARIATYRVDAKDPANTRIKLELLSGVARSRSGEAVKLARQNFRFNTPVAAIGVRGTDFTVSTDNNVTRVAVISGGIVMSGFADGCRPEGAGPCEGGASRELSSAQRGVLLQVRRGQQAPQLLAGSVSSDQLIPAADAALKSVPATVVEPDLDPKKNELIQQPSAPPPAVPPAPVPEPIPAPVPEPVPVPPAEPAPVPVEQPDRKLVWGRWVPVMEQAAQFDLAQQKAAADLVGVNGSYALLSTRGRDYAPPERGSIAFTLQDGVAHVTTRDANGSQASAASLQNGMLSVDFDKRTFNTSIDVVHLGGTSNLHAQGAVTAAGGLYGDLSFDKPGYMNVRGQLSNENGGAGAYIFDAVLDSSRRVNGATYWRETVPRSPRP